MAMTSSQLMSSLFKVVTKTEGLTCTCVEMSIFPVRRRFNRNGSFLLCKSYFLHILCILKFTQHMQFSFPNPICEIDVSCTKGGPSTVFLEIAT